MSINFYSTKDLPNFVKLDLNETGNDEQGKVVVPGESITDDGSFMSGFGTYKDQGVIRSSVAGRVKVLNKLIISTSLRARYSGEIGDVVVARVTDVAQKRWKVDVNSTQDGMLLLSSVILPGGIQRRKSDSDELKMRTYLTEGDLLVCEVQAFYQDGSLGLHTRSTKYGKLGEGHLVKIPPLLVQRARSHFLTLSCDVSVILALNGYIFVSKHNPQTLNDLNYDTTAAPLTDTDRDTLARVSNAIRGLAVLSVPINEQLLNLVFEVSLKYSAKDLLITRILVKVVQEAILLSQQ